MLTPADDHSRGVQPFRHCAGDCRPRSWVEAGEFLTAATEDIALIADLDPQAKSLEGYLFPDTYRFQRTSQPDNCRGHGAAVPAGSASIGVGSATITACVTLASLVERETAVAADRPLVASVLTNRLAKDMPLMTDPTVIYAALLEKQYRGAIYQSDLKRDSGLQHLPPYRPAARTDLQPGHRFAAGGDASCREQVPLFCCRCGGVWPLPVCRHTGRARAQCKRLPAGAEGCPGDPLKRRRGRADLHAVRLRLHYTRIS